MIRNMKIVATGLCMLVTLSAFAQEAVHVFGNKKFICKKGDIARQRTQAIVNAANEQLAFGGGVCGAIFRAAGIPALRVACNQYKLINKSGTRCPVGQACITPSFRLMKNNVEYIIHAVGPDCRVPALNYYRELLLASAYRLSFSLAKSHNIKSISLPFISSAIYEYPLEEAADIAIDQILNCVYEDAGSIQEIRMVLFSQADFDLFVSRLIARDIAFSMIEGISNDGEAIEEENVNPQIQLVKHTEKPAESVISPIAIVGLCLSGFAAYVTYLLQ